MTLPLVDLSSVEHLPEEITWVVGEVWRPGQGVMCAQMLIAVLSAAFGYCTIRPRDDS